MKTLYTKGRVDEFGGENGLIDDDRMIERNLRKDVQSITHIAAYDSV